MPKNGTYALSLRLSALITLLCVPSFLLALYLADLRRDQELEHIRSEAMTLALSIANQQAQTFEKMRTQIARLSKDLPTISGEGCDIRLQDLRQFNPQYAQLAVADPTGNIICAARDAHIATVKDRAYFQTALTSSDFALSDALLGRSSNRWTVVAAQPVLKGNLISAVVLASLDIGWTQSLLGRLSLPQNSIVSLADRHGRILARVPEPEKFVGREIKESASFSTAVTTQSSGFAHSAGLDGVARVIAYARIPDTGLFVRVGIPTTEVQAAGDSALQAGLFTLIATVLCTRAVRLGGFAPPAVAADRPARQRRGKTRQRRLGGAHRHRSPRADRRASGSETGRTGALRPEHHPCLPHAQRGQPHAAARIRRVRAAGSHVQGGGGEWRLPARLRQLHAP